MIDTERLCLGCMNDNNGEKVCSICGYDTKLNNDAEFLPVRFWIKGRYYVGKAIESNGEGVTYIGWDNKEDAIVNIREYFPKGAANRAENGRVIINEDNKFVFNEGIMSFLELNRRLMSLKGLPAILPVIEVFEENGTAYSITKAVAGVTLREFLIRNGGDLNWEQARPLFLPVITTLAELHEAGIIHRGISPETIIVGRDGKLRLIDFCIRSVRMSKSNMVIQLFPGYSAAEQYDYDIAERDGRYTDVYGIAATFFRVLLGKAPTDVPERITNDNMQISAKMAEKLPKHVLAALANALQIMPQNRTQDMDAFRISLTPASAEATNTVKIAEPKKAAVAPAPKEKEEKKDNSSKKYAIISSAVTATVFIALALAVYFIFLKPAAPSGGESEQPSSSEQPPSSITENIIMPDEDKLYQVPKLAGKKYSEVISNNDYNQLYVFIEEDLAYSDDVEKGRIISQSPEADQSVKKGTEIKLVVSAGPRNIAVPSLAGKTKGDAILELLKAGFDFDNIEILNVYDATKKKDVVVATEPAAKAKISRNATIVLRVNAQDQSASSGSDSASGNSSTNSDNN